MMDGNEESTGSAASRRTGVSRRRFMKGAALGAGVAATDFATIGNLVAGASNSVTAENSQPGSAEWDIGYTDDSIEGFATKSSVNRGESIAFKIRTASTRYRIDIYRIGWYGGAGGRKVATLTPSVALPQTQPAPVHDTALGLVDCGNWAVSATWNVPLNAVSGVYVANFIRQDVPGLANRTIFVVREDGRQSDILIQTSDTTYQAYNLWGGNSLYDGDGQAIFGRAVKVSYNRPYGNVPLENEFYYAELPLVRWLERNGYDVTYCASIDTERRPQELLQHKVFVSSGHDEYWSGGMRANVEAARDAGVNLVFMTGNEVFWKVRWEPSVDGTGTADRTMVCYKETLNDAKVDPSPEWTGTWRDPRFSPPSNGGRPENELTGTLFKAINSSDDVDFAIKVPAEYASLRFWRNTSVASLLPGQTATLTNATLGYEWNTDDGVPSRPPGLIRLSQTTEMCESVMLDYGKNYAPGPLTHYMTMYRNPSGALVWSTGTVQWSWGLDDYHTNRPVFDVPVDQRIQQATLNALADMGCQPSSRQPNLAAAAKSTDTIPPVTTITSPAPGSAIRIGSPLTVSGTATDSGGGAVAAIEVSIDGGSTWHPAIGKNSWSYTFVPTQLGTINIRVRGIDDSCNIEPDDGGATFVAIERVLPGSLWNTAFFPAVAANADTAALELGLRFRSSLDGFVTGIRFYKGAGNGGTHVGRIWTSAGRKLGEVTFTDETGTGWQTAMFSSPIAVTSGNDYIASYSAPQGRYSSDTNYFAESFELAPLAAPAHGDGGSNGVFALTPGSFPSRTFGATNYWVDPIFDTNDYRGPTVLTTSPGIDVSQVEPSSVIEVTFNEPMKPATIVFELASHDGPVPGATSYDAPSRTLRFAPGVELAPLTSYTATVLEGLDSHDTPMTTEYSWSFTTVGGVGTVPTSIWTSASIPVIRAVDDAYPVELGVKFSSSKAGQITAVRFYKGPGNGGNHIGRIWTVAGELLASVTFPNESVEGWQEGRLETPVEIAKNTVYVVSYFAAEGRYAVTSGGLNSQVTRGPLRAYAGGDVGGNGLFRYSPEGGFPTASYGNANYWVDVVFTQPADQTPVIVTSSTPASNLEAVGLDQAIAVAFDKAVTPSSVVFSVSGSTGTVAGSTAVDPTGVTATFTPIAPLEPGTLHTATVSATSANGVPMPNAHQFAFTTATTIGSVPATLWTTATTPAVQASDDKSAVELGVKFRADVDGAITAIRFFKGEGNEGPHIGHLWSESGELLASAAFSTESASGWQQANFGAPVAVSAGVTYVASYHTPSGRYAVTAGGLQGGMERAPLRALPHGSSGGNGLYRYGPGGYPSSAYNGGNYWVDVVFVDQSGPAVTARIPEVNESGVAAGTSIGVTFNEAVVASSIQLTLRDSQGALVPTSPVVYDVTTRRATVQPIDALAGDATYTVSVASAIDQVGNPMAAAVSWSFSTLGAAAISLFGDATPAIASADDASAVELGMKFSVATPVELLGIRFFRGPANTGAQIGRVWTPDGTLIAEVQFNADGPQGWKSAVLATPVALPAGNYVVSYFAPAGGYSVTPAYFATGVSAGPLSAPSSSDSGGNGLYRYGGGFPSSSYNAGNYWVDVLVR